MLLISFPMSLYLVTYCINSSGSVVVVVVVVVVVAGTTNSFVVDIKVEVLEIVTKFSTKKYPTFHNKKVSMTNEQYEVVSTFNLQDVIDKVPI